MFERFTDRSRRVVVLAQEEARALNHQAIDVEHLLIALAAEDEGIAAVVLRGYDLDKAKLQRYARTRFGEDASVGVKPVGHLPFTSQSKRALERANRAALSRGHNYVGTEHLLLGIVELAGPGSSLLGGLGLDASAVSLAVDDAMASFDFSAQKYPPKSPPLTDPSNFASFHAFTTELHSAQERFRAVLADNERLIALLIEHGIDPQTEPGRATSEPEGSATADEPAQELDTKPAEGAPPGMVAGGRMGRVVKGDAAMMSDVPRIHEELRCSFCGKGQRSVAKLIAGPGVYVCSECIDLCHQIIDEELQTKTPEQRKVEREERERIRDQWRRQEREKQGVPEGAPDPWSREPLRCSFCAKPKKFVAKLIAGPAVYICDECIDLCSQIIDEELGGGSPAVTPASD